MPRKPQDRLVIQATKRLDAVEQAVKEARTINDLRTALLSLLNILRRIL